MLCEVLYYDRSVSENELQRYEVEAQDPYQAEEYFKQFIGGMTGITILFIGIVGVDHDEDPDAHSCRAEADAYGICSVCGSIVHGTFADYELHGYDPI